MTESNDRTASDGWAAFRYRDYRFFFASRFFVTLSMHVQNVSVAWLVYDVTGDPFALALVGLASFLPTVALVLATGHIADRYDRRLILVGSYLAMALCAAGLLFTAGHGAPERLWPIYLLLMGFGAARAFANPAGQALAPGLVAPEHFANAVAWNSSAVHTATIAGPALGGFLYVLGPWAAFSTAVCGFAVAIVLVAMIRGREAARSREPMSWERLSAGVRFIRSQPVMLGAISLDLFAVLLSGTTALLPIYARDILDVGPVGLGLLRSMPACGAVLMAFALAHTGLLSRRAGLRMFQAVLVFGAGTVVFGLSESLPLSMAMLMIMGAVDMVSVVVRQTIMQIETPDALRGRVAAVNSLFISASNELGEFQGGIMAGLVGAVATAMFGGVGTMTVALLWMRLFPELRARNQLTRDPAREEVQQQTA